MNNENIELLLERLVTVNEQILETVTDIKNEVQGINRELNWVGEATYAKIVTDSLNEIEVKLDAIELNTTEL